MFYPFDSRPTSIPHDPLKAIIAPRPIGWISAVSAAGAVNLSPYSFFNALSTRPMIVGFGSDGRKDAVAFIEETQEFVCNLVTYPFREAMNVTSASLPRGQSEFAHAGLEMEASQLVRPPRVKGVAAALECRLCGVQQLRRPDGAAIDNYLVLGEVVGVYIDDAMLTADGRFDTAKAQPVARCGYADYAVVTELFSMTRPG